MNCCTVSTQLSNQISSLNSMSPSLKPSFPAEHLAIDYTEPQVKTVH